MATTTGDPPGVAEAAAFHGLATNPTVPGRDRLAMALQALDGYEAEIARLSAEAERVAPVVEAARQWRELFLAGPGRPFGRLIGTPEDVDLIAAVDTAYAGDDRG